MKISRQSLGRALAIGAVSSVVWLAACSSEKPKNVEKSDYSGFLTDYSRLQPATSPSGSPVMRWISPDLRKGHYTKVYLEPPVLYLGKGQQPTKQVSRETMDQIVAYFGNAQREILQRNGELASAPGPNTLRVRTAITSVRAKEQGLKGYEYIPVALVFAEASKAVGERSEDVTVYVEGEASDSQTGELLAEFARMDEGPKLPNEETPLTLKDVQPLLDKWVAAFYTQMKNLTQPQP